MAIGHQQLRNLALTHDRAERTDGQLLAGYVNRNDSAALEALVLRQGPMVWGVCSRMLNQHDAEDAFQATFLVLVRKAPSIVPREMVVNWLYGVACQTARNVRTQIARRGAREVQVTEMPEPVVAEEQFWPALQPILDRELSCLPGKYRTAIVLCDLEGKTRKEAAHQLGLAEGTVASRLARGRTLLAYRLARLGLAVTVGALETVLPQRALGLVPTSLLATTIKSVTLIAAGQTVTGLLSVEVSHLTERVLKTMYLTKLRTAITALFVAVIAMAGAVGIGLSALSDDGTQDAKKDPPKSKEEKPPQPPQKVDTTDPVVLLKAKLNAAKAAYTGAWKSLGEVKRVGDSILPVGIPEDAYTWSVRWLNSQLDMSDKRNERIAALEEHLQRMKDMETKLEAMIASAIIPVMNAAAAKWYLAEAQLWLAKEKAK